MCIILVSTWVESTGIYKWKVGTQLKCVHTHDLLTGVVQYMYCTNKCISTVNFSRHNSWHHGKLLPYRASRVISKFKKKKKAIALWFTTIKKKRSLNFLGRLPFFCEYFWHDAVVHCTAITRITKEWPTCVGVVCTILAGGHGPLSPSVLLCGSAEFQPFPGNHPWSTNGWTYL